MSLKSIREYYKVPAEYNGKVLFGGQIGVIVGAYGPYLKVRFRDFPNIDRYLHPTYEIKYLEENQEVTSFSVK